MRANVYRIADPTSDSLHRLGAVSDDGEVIGYAVVVGRVDPDGTAVRADGTPAGQAAETGALQRDGAPVGHVSREGSVYRGVALVPQAVVGYVDPSVPRPLMGGAALLLGLLD